MHAVIRAGGKQHKVAKGDVIEIERVKGSDELEFTPLLIIDDKGRVRSGKSELARARVTAKVVGDGKGPKIDVLKFRNKVGYRRHTGHRQRYSQVEISDIKLTTGRSKSQSSSKESDDGT